MTLRVEAGVRKDSKDHSGHNVYRPDGADGIIGV